MTFSAKVKNEIQNKYFTSPNHHSKITGDDGGPYARGILRELFMESGTMSDPMKSYHLEFGSDSASEAEELRELLRKLGITGGVIKRRRRYGVYLKDGESISAVLAVLGAHNALLEFENIRALREMREGVQRRVNCETANISRTVSASLKQIEEIRLIDERIGLKSLTPALRETAELRLRYPDATLSELSGMLPGVGRSGINHRFRKLSEIAGRLQ